MDGDGVGDQCDPDRDGDRLLNEDEPHFGLDPDVRDSDGDGVDDGVEFGCLDTCPEEPENTSPSTPIDALNEDSDADSISDHTDNCRVTHNPRQADLDMDGVGDLCDIDAEGDGIRAQYDCDDFDATLRLHERDSDCDGVDNQPMSVHDLIDCGESFTCMIDPSGALVCAGQNHYQQLQVPTDSEGWAYRDWVQFSLGFNHACGVRLNGSVVCWGANYDGRGSLPLVDALGIPHHWVQVVTGFAHTCALSASGQVLCTGANFDGQGDVLWTIDRDTQHFKTLSAAHSHLRTDSRQSTYLLRRKRYATTTCETFVMSLRSCAVENTLARSIQIGEFNAGLGTIWSQRHWMNRAHPTTTGQIDRRDPLMRDKDKTRMLWAKHG